MSHFQIQFLRNNVKKTIFLSAMCASALLGNETIKLDEITTISTATKTEKKIDGVAASVEVITEKEIQKMGAESLKDVLNNTSGLSVQYGTFPSASAKSKSSVSVRGMGAKGTLFLVDGRRLGGEVSNPYDLDRIPASQIEKIEIVKGPMSTLYGADAVGGVINIITKKPQSGKPQINFGLRYGQNSDGDDQNTNINLGLKGKENKFGYSLYVNKTDTTPYAQKETANVYVKQVPDGKTKSKPSTATGKSGDLKGLSDTYTHDVTYKEESDILTYGARFEYDFSDKVTAGVELNAFSEERDGSYVGYFHPSNVPLTNGYVPVYNIPVNSKDTNDKLDIAADIKVVASDALTYKIRAYQSYYEKRNKTTTPYYSELKYGSEEASAQNGMDANVDIKSIEGVANYLANENHLLTLGAESRSEDRESSVFSQAKTMSSKSVDYKALYLQDEWMINDTLNAIFGARYDDISNADSKATFKAGVIKNFSKEFNLRANVAQGYRTPDIRELYIFKNTANGSQRGADTVDNDLDKTVYALKPESTTTYEVGMGGKIGNTKYDLAIFHNSIEDLISETLAKSTSGIPYYTFINIPKASTYGTELAVTHNFSDSLGVNFNWTELRTKNDTTNKELEFNPERVMSAKLTYQASSAIDTSLGAKYIGEQYYRETVNRGTPTESIKDSTTKAYTTIDWNINYDYSKQVALYGGINNIADEKIEDILGSSSGRYYFTGVKITF